MIPYGRQDLDEADIAAVVDVLRSDFLTQGPLVPRFEACVARRSGAQFAVAGNSATSMLHVACLALGLGPGDWLWTVPNTFVASANCGRYCGARIGFVDIDPETWNMSMSALADKLVAARRSGSLPKIVIPVDFGGLPVPIDNVAGLAREFGFRVVEDASHAIGATRRGASIGAASGADIVILSFHPVKIVTSGEGGMALTNDAELAERMTLLRSHGVTRDPRRLSRPSPGAWYYEQIVLGFNYRMTDIQAALGLAQMRRLDTFLARRDALAERYKAGLMGLPLRWQVVPQGMTSAYHLFVVRVDRARARRSHGEIHDALRRAGIGANLHYMPVHLQPYYRAQGHAPGDYPEAERHGEEAITLPLFPAMTDSQQDHVVATLREVLA